MCKPEREYSRKIEKYNKKRFIPGLLGFVLVLNISFAAVINSVQRGTLTSSGNGAVTATINTVDLSKSFLIFNTRHNSNRPPGSMIRGRIKDATTVEFVRNTNETSTMVIQWYVVEFTSGVKVQRGAVNQTNKTVNVSITPVSSLNQAFVTWSKTPASGDGSWNSDDPIVGELTNTGNLQFRANDSNNNHTIWWQVIEFTNAADINVQKGSITSMTGSVKQVTATLNPPVDVNKTFVLVGYRTSGSGSDIGKRMLRARLQNSTTLEIKRDISGSGDDITEIVWQAIELKDGSTVQHGEKELKSNHSQKTVSLTNVDINRSIAFASVQSVAGQSLGSTKYSGNDIVGVGSFTLALTANQLTLERSNTFSTSKVDWFVVEFNAAGNTGQTFTEITSSSGLNNVTGEYSVSWGDYDNNGYPDLWVGKEDKLYKNNGDGTFASGMSLHAKDRAGHWGDFDNDGDLDFFATLNPHFHVNNGDGTFTEQNNSSVGFTGVTNLGDAVWMDYNEDGLLDLFAPDGSHGNHMFKNNGDGTFTSQGANQLGLTPSSNGETVVAADYDGDGHTDILYRRNKAVLWHSNGDGTYTNVTTSAGIDLNGTSGGYNGTAFGDYDNDGDLDIYGGQSGSNKLYRNNGDGTFTDVTSAAGVGGGSFITKGVTWGDFDNDGDLDLYVANKNGANKLFRNNGNGTFTDVASYYGLNDASQSYGATWADFDLDGDLDIFVANKSNASKLFRNDLNNNNYLRVKVTGLGIGNSPKDGIGSRVELWDSNQNNLLAVREVMSNEGMGSQQPHMVHFGLASAWGGGSGTYTVKVKYPSGTEVTKVNVVPTSASLVIGSTTVNNAIEVIETGTTVTPFTIATADADLDDSQNKNTYGIAWGDYNRDGYPDLYISGVDKLFKNDGDGTFSPGPALTGGTTYSRAAHWGDYDNDGDLDFFATWNMNFSKNNGNNSFTLQNNTAIGFTQINNLGDGAFLDYNNDGYLDVWAPNGSPPYGYMYSNNGDGTFTAVAGSGIGLTANVNGETTIPVDYNGDGYVDILYRANNVFLFKNNGDGTFSNVTSTAGISLTGYDGGYNGTAFGDYDNDGDLDLYGGQNGNNKLYRNNGDGTFTDVTASAGVAGGSSKTHGVAWGDFDNDGDLDLYVANNNGNDFLYRNNGDGTFTDVYTIYGLSQGSSAHGAVWADYDLDGDLDLYVGNNSHPGRLYRNEENSTNYLKVKVTGAGAGKSPVDGTGSRVELWNSTGTVRYAVREVTGGTGYGSHEPRIVHFGLASSWGGGSGTYTIKVKFTSGSEETVSNIVPTSSSIKIGGTTLNNTIEVRETAVVLVSEWRMDECSWGGISGEVVDATGNGNNGTPHGGVNTGAGQICKGGVFDGNDDYVISNPYNIPTDEISVSFWMKTSDNTKSGTPVSYAASSSDNEFLIYNYKNFAIYRGSKNISTGVSANDGNWHHIVVTWRGSDGATKLYKDGTEAFSGTLAPGTTITSGGSLVIGQEQSNVGGGFSVEQAFLGSMDEVIIYKQVLPLSEVQKIYNNQLAEKNADGTDRTCASCDPVAEWLLDECSWGGTTGEVADNTGNGHDGTAVGGLTTANGKVCESGDFDGIDDYLEFPDDSALDITSELTIALWVYPNSVSNERVIVSKGSGCGNYNLFIRNGKLGLLSSGDCNWAYEGSNAIVTTGSWQHIAATYDGSSIRYYVNGVLKDVVASSSGLGATNSDPLRIGGPTIGGWSLSRYFDGKIDEVLIYDRALATPEVQSIYANQSSGKNADGSTRDCTNCGPVVEWRMDECTWDGTSGEVEDATGNGNNGTTHGGVNTDAGQICKGGVFDGNNDYVIMNPFNIPTGAISVSFWMKTSDNTKSGTPVSYAASSSDNEFLIYNYKNFAIYRGSKNISTGVSANDGNWHHIVVTWRGSDGATKLYKDGTVAFSGTLAPGTTITSGGSLVIGQEQDKIGGGFSTGQAFLGSFDELAVYDQALSLSEVQTIYNNQLAEKNADGTNRSCSSCEPMAIWYMDEAAWNGTNDEVADSSGNDNHGTGKNGVSTIENGKIGRAGSFDGTDDYVAIGKSLLNNLSEFTLAGWIRPRSGGSRIGFFGQNNAIEFGFITGTVVNVWTSGGGSASANYTNAMNEWHHVAAVGNGASLKIYIDGVLAGTGGTSTTNYGSSGYTVNIGGGGIWDASGNFFKGDIDEVYMYDRALSTTEIQDLYNSTRTCYTCGDGLAVFWQMDECYWDGTSGEVADSSDGNLNATAQGGAATDDAKLCRGGSFDGVDDYLKTDNTTLFSGKTAVSVALWANFDGTGDQMLIQKAEDSNAQSPAFNLDYSGGKLRFSVYSSDTDYYKEYYTWNPATGTWYHIAAVFAKDSTDKIKLYVNGSEVNTTGVTAGTFTGIRNVSNPLIVGKYRPSDPRWFGGKLDEVRIYSAAITAGDIQTLMNETRTCTDCSVPAADLSWYMDKCEWTGANDEVTDASGNGNNGTVNGGANTGDGKVCRSGILDGSNDYIIKNPFNIPSDKLSVSFWMKTSDNTKSGTPISYAAATSDNEFLIYNYKNIAIYRGGKSIGTGVSANDGNWHHIVVTWRGSDGATRLYKDGSQVFSGILAPGTTITQGGSFIVGQEQDNVGGGFNANQAFLGAIDEVQVFDQILTPYHVQTLYTQTSRNCTDCTPDPLASWYMDEAAWDGTSEEVVDSSGNGYHGTGKDGANTTANGKVGRAGSFDGVNDYVQLPAGADIGGLNTASMFMWVKLNELNREQIFYGTLTHRLGLKPDNHLGQQFSISGNTLYPTGSTALTTGVWYHVGFTYDGTRLQLWLNGQVDASVNASGALDVSGATPRLGERGDGLNYYNGLIDEVYLYDRVLTASDIQTLMNKTHPCAGCTDTTEFTGFPRKKWVLWGVPVDPKPDNDVFSVVADDFGGDSANGFNWDAARWNHSRGQYDMYSQMPNTFDKFAPGLGFWLIQDVLDSTNIDVTGTRKVGNFSVDLKAPLAGNSWGNNMLADPYTHALDWSDCRVTDGTDTLTIQQAGAQGWINSHAYIWNYTDEVYEVISPKESNHTDTLTVSEGFWVLTIDKNKDLDFIFRESISMPKLIPQPPRVFVSRFGDDIRPLRRFEEAGLNDWAGILYLYTKDGDYALMDNRFGVNTNANDGFDGVDAAWFPPSSDAYGALYFIAGDGSQLVHDIRDPNWTEKTWDFFVSDHNVNGDWVLRWPNLSSIPGNIRLSLESPEGTVVVPDLRNEMSYEFSLTSGSEQEFFLKATVGPDSIAATTNIGFVQNPGVTQALDLYLFPSELLSDLLLFVDGQLVPVKMVDGLYNVYRGSMEMFEGGEKELVTHLTDTESNLAVDTTYYNFVLVDGSGGTLLARAPDGQAVVSVSGATLPKGSWIGIGNRAPESVGAKDNLLSAIYSIQPTGLKLPEGTELIFVGVDPWKIPGTVQVFRETSTGWVGMPTSFDPVDGNIRALITQSGNYTLRRSQSGDVGSMVPTQTVLMANYPNPFNATTVIPYTLQGPAMVSIQVYDLLGREVINLLHKYQNAGYYRLRWDGKDHNGKPLSSGVYLVRFQADRYLKTQKLMLLK